MNLSAFFKAHKPETVLGAGAAVVTVVLAMRARSKNAAGSSAATTSSSGTAYPASSVLPVTTADTTSSDAFTGIEDQVVGLQSALLALQNPAAPSGTAVTTPSTPAAPAPAPAPAPNQGFGEVQTALGPMDWLGVWGQPTYQVGGGAPVYFGNTGSLAQGNPQPGEDVYVPVEYQSLISSKPS